MNANGSRAEKETTIALPENDPDLVPSLFPRWKKALPAMLGRGRASVLLSRHQGYGRIQTGLGWAALLGAVAAPVSLVGALLCPGRIEPVVWGSSCLR